MSASFLCPRACIARLTACLAASTASTLTARFIDWALGLVWRWGLLYALGSLNHWNSLLWKWLG